MLILVKITGSKHTVRTAVLNMLSGLAALCAVELASGLTGIFIPISRLSLAVSGFLGLPGVTSMLLLQTFL